MPLARTGHFVSRDPEVAFAARLETEQSTGRVLGGRRGGHHIKYAVEAEGFQVHRALEVRQGLRAPASAFDLHKGRFARG